MNNSDVSLIILTKGKLGFLLRTLDFYSSTVDFKKCKFIVMDGSDESYFENSVRQVSLRNYDLDIRMINTPSKKYYIDRFIKFKKELKSTYVLLAADDDYYVDGWLANAKKLLATDNGISVVYGQTLRFALADYSPYGEMLFFEPIGERSPPLVWLEHATPAERLLTLMRLNSDWPTMGFYALQRSELLLEIADYAQKNNLDAFSLEKFMIFVQVLAGKVRMLELPYCVRQVNNSYVRPLFKYSSERAHFKVLGAAMHQVLDKYIGGEYSKNLVRKLLWPERRSLLMNEVSYYLRLLRIRPSIKLLIKKISKLTARHEVLDPKLKSVARENEVNLLKDLIKISVRSND